ncbi:amidohydrolase family protein [Streptomyces sp. NPDC001941]|uniref:amidohydrolase family protein n=1 Tax=Streptomyces sp. NPDC001941 TaxID=3154659 RepID=UPI00332A1CC4
MLITAGRILTAPGEYLTDGAVLVSGDTIAAVGPRVEVEARASAGEPRLAFPEGTVVPGLIDAHVHLCFDGSADPVAGLAARENGELLEDMKDRARQLLASGVTTVRDLGDRDGLALALAARIAEGAEEGPRIVSAGVPVTSRGGHCYFLGGEVSGAAEIRALVGRNAAAGAKVIKVMETGGGLTKDGAKKSWEAQFSREELAVLVAEAHAAGLPVAAHAHGTEGIAAAVGAGVDTLEHCTWMAPGRGFDLREDVLAEIVAKGVHVCPTVSEHWPMLPKVFGEEWFAEMGRIVRAMADAGARIVLGTDAGVQRTGFGGLPASMKFYAHLGLDPARILEMATGEAARALGLEGVTGRIAEGHGADLLVVSGDPLQDLDALRNVTAVIAAGRQYGATTGN